MTNVNITSHDNNSSWWKKIVLIWNKISPIIWPIESYELKKFLPMAFIMFCVLFNYTTLRILKDSLVVPGIGSEAIPFLKTYIVIPFAIFFTIIYMTLLNKFGDIKIFYIIGGAFAAFFTIFAFILYPNEHMFHPNAATISQLTADFPRFKWFILIYGKWIYAAMYLFAELWGSIMLSLLFWQFANKITTTVEAKRFYSMFGLIANFGVIASGTVTRIIASSAENNSAIVNLTIVVIAITIISLLIFQWMNNKVLTDIRYYNPSEVKSAKSKKPKLSIGDSMKLIFSSRYLGLIALLVLAYGVSINLVEVSWKNKVRELFPNPIDYLKFNGFFMQFMGVGAVFFMILGSNILRICSWRVAASFTPIAILLTGFGFFIFSAMQSELDVLSNSLFGVSALVVAVILGAIQNIFSKGIKYSLFDSTKEMAYIPLDDELKTRGKAAVEVIGGRLGKGGGGFIQSTLLFIYPAATTHSLLGYVMVIFVLVLLAWLYSVNILSKEYSERLEKQKS